MLTYSIWFGTTLPAMHRAGKSFRFCLLNQLPALQCRKQNIQGKQIVCIVSFSLYNFHNVTKKESRDGGSFH